MAKITLEQIDATLANIRVEGAALQYKQTVIEVDNTISEFSKACMLKTIKHALISNTTKGAMVYAFKQHCIDTKYFDV